MSAAGPPKAGASDDVRRPDEAEVAELTTRFVRLAAHVPSEELRAKAAAGALADLAPALAVRIAGRLVRAARDDAPAQTALDALARALARGLFHPDFVADCVGLARSRADRLAEALFASGPALREYDHNHEQFVDRRMRQLTAGERRTLSKSRDIDVLLRLAHDQDVRVVRELLGNPRLTEREAVIIASRRPTHPHVLEAVLASRFGISRRVRRSVAHNPYAPVALAVRALAGLTTPELEEVGRDEKVSEEVRRHARSLAHAHRATAAEKARAAAPDAPDPELDELLRQLSSDDDEELTVMGPDERER